MEPALLLKRLQHLRSHALARAHCAVDVAAVHGRGLASRPVDAPHRLADRR